MMCIRHVGTLTCSEWAEIRSMQKNPPHHEILVQMVSNRIWLGTRDWFILLFLIGCGHGFSLTRVTRGKKEIKTHSRWQLDIKVPKQNWYLSNTDLETQNELAKAKSSSRVPCWPNDGYFMFCTLRLYSISWVFKENIRTDFGGEISSALSVTLLKLKTAGSARWTSSKKTKWSRILETTCFAHYDYTQNPQISRKKS